MAVPRGHLARAGLEVILLIVAVACGTVNRAVPLSWRSYLLETPPFDLPTPTPPLAMPTSFPTRVLTPAPVTPTPKPPPTPLPTATLPLPLDQAKKAPAPSTTVLGHGLRLPPGFQVAVYAHGLPTVANMAYADDGVLMASLPGKGAVVALPDPGGSGQAQKAIVFAQGLTYPSGLAFHDGYLYVAEASQIVRFQYTTGQLSAQGAAEVVVPNLPAGSVHLSHAIGFGPDDKLYVGIGSSCNACKEADYRRATIMRYNPDGSQEELYAQGLRDAEALCWYPNTHQLLVTNCSRERMGDDMPPDTIEYVYAGVNFGWPFCHAGDVPDPELGWPGVCDMVPQSFYQFQAHSTPQGMCVYLGSQFPPEYYGDIFVALSGSWERTVPVGYKIVRLNVEKGQIVGQEDFASGWLEQWLSWGRPIDLVQAPDGSLLVSDDRSGAILRIFYRG